MDNEETAAGKVKALALANENAQEETTSRPPAYRESRNIVFQCDLYLGEEERQEARNNEHWEPASPPPHRKLGEKQNASEGKTADAPVIRNTDEGFRKKIAARCLEY